MTVLILGQNPKTKKNVKRPFIGTRSAPILDKWIQVLGFPDFILMNASKKVGRVTWKDYDVDGVTEAISECDRFIALGAYASGLFDRLGVRHFTLPHPSGLNRKLNDREELQHQLLLCKVYLGGGR